LGTSLPALIFWPAMAGVGRILLVAALARALGAQSFGTAFAAFVTALAPVWLAIDHQFAMNALEPLFWIGCALVLVRIIQTENPKLWMIFGMLAGLGLENKYSMAVFAFALLAGILLTPERKILFTPWLFAGGVIALLIFLPNLLKQKGVTVYTTVSTPEKAALVREAGAEEAILYTEVDFVEMVRSFTRGNGVHVVYDSVGKTTYEGSLNVLRPFGMLVLFGQSSGPVPPIDPLLLHQKGSLFLTWPSLAHHIADAASFHNRATKVLNWVAQKSLKLRIERTYPLAEVAKAQKDLEARRTTGKLVVEIN
jgi:4-amino-4-deoxy-L-arabinose transferase-like glycosyltransferase